jgi:large subunit ribosomal protein L29
VRPRDIRRRESGDLEQEIVRLREQVFKQRFRGQSEEKVDRGAIRRDRRDVARIRTILRERELGIEAAGARDAQPAGRKVASSTARKGGK